MRHDAHANLSAFQFGGNPYKSRPTGEPARQIQGFSRQLHVDLRRAAVREADALHGVADFRKWASNHHGLAKILMLDTDPRSV
jgi:hypothetical protein